MSIQWSAVQWGRISKCSIGGEPFELLTPYARKPKDSSAVVNVQ